jgi:hypothetical protein
MHLILFHEISYSRRFEFGQVGGERFQFRFVITYSFFLFYGVFCRSCPRLRDSVFTGAFPHFWDAREFEN